MTSKVFFIDWSYGGPHWSPEDHGKVVKCFSYEWYKEKTAAPDNYNMDCSELKYVASRTKCFWVEGESPNRTHPSQNDSHDSGRSALDHVRILGLRIEPYHFGEDNKIHDSVLQHFKISGQNVHDAVERYKSITGVTPYEARRNHYEALARLRLRERKSCNDAPNWKLPKENVKLEKEEVEAEAKRLLVLSLSRLRAATFQLRPDGTASMIVAQKQDSDSEEAETSDHDPEE